MNNNFVWYKRNHVGSLASSRASVPPSRRVDSRTRLLVGAIIGSVVGLVVIVVAILLWRHYCRVRNRDSDASEGGEAGELVETGNGRRSSAVYSERPPSDPFASEVKTVVSSKDDQSQLGSPLKEDFSISSAPQPHLIEPRPSESHDIEAEHTVEPDLRMSSEVHGMPELSRTFLANVRPTARSPPPL